MNVLKKFFYKIISHEVSTEVLADVNLHERNLCFICKDNIDPTLKESITILNCKHFFHKLYIERWADSQCSLCQEECIESTELGNCYSQESTQGISTQLDNNLQIVSEDSSEEINVQISRQASSIESLLNPESDTSITTSPISTTFAPISTTINTPTSTTTTTDITTSAPALI
ncbi:6846_t:CDS:1 [Racocetra fulgida]|uniref:6846_t:CDS:1 n=1 Tax=Racocetra fulgida TaxID=60492 RepID=A0A9N9HC08_9GLOM|nr:6846_t:CDS:1 [Racocetra fulgida]